MNLVAAPALEEEVLRINARYNAEFIEAFSLCPYARPARATGHSVREVLWLREPSPAEAVKATEKRLQDASVEVVQSIFPLLRVDAGTFQQFAVDTANQMHPDRERPTFVIAAFHPELPYSAATPARLVPFFRRSPDPLLQFVRLSVLDALHGSRPRGTFFFDGPLTALPDLLASRPPSITDRITDDNHAAAMNGTFAAMQAVLENIAADRLRSYAPFALRSPTKHREKRS